METIYMRTPRQFSHLGQRDTNQDILHIESINETTTLYIIADGMGAYTNSKYAAQIAINKIVSFFKTTTTLSEDKIQEAINNADDAITKEQQTLGKMGTTIGGLFIQENKAIGFWVGDIKIIHLKNNRVLYESAIHTLQNYLRQKDPNNEYNQYRNVVTRAICGDKLKCKASTKRWNSINSTDHFILCSDGVHNYIDCHEIEKQILHYKNIYTVTDHIEQELLSIAEDNFSLIAI